MKAIKKLCLIFATSAAITFGGAATAQTTSDKLDKKVERHQKINEMVVKEGERVALAQQVAADFEEQRKKIENSAPMLAANGKMMAPVNDDHRPLDERLQNLANEFNKTRSTADVDISIYIRKEKSGVVAYLVATDKQFPDYRPVVYANGMPGRAGF